MGQLREDATVTGAAGVLKCCAIDVVDFLAFSCMNMSQGMVDLKTQLDNLQRTRMGLKVKKGNVGGGKSFKAVVHKADSKSPDKPTPTARPRLLLPTVSGSAGASASASIGFSIGGSTASSVTTESHKLPYALHYKNTASPLNGPAGTAGNSSTDTHHRQDVHADDGSLDDQTEQESEQVIEKDVYAVRRTDYGEIVDFAASELGQRRLHLAHKVRSSFCFVGSIIVLICSLSHFERGGVLFSLSFILILIH